MDSQSSSLLESDSLSDDVEVKMKESDEERGEKRVSPDGQQVETTKEQLNTQGANLLTNFGEDDNTKQPELHALIEESSKEEDEPIQVGTLFKKDSLINQNELEKQREFEIRRQ